MLLSCRYFSISSDAFPPPPPQLSVKVISIFLFINNCGQYVYFFKITICIQILFAAIPPPTYGSPTPRLRTTGVDRQQWFDLHLRGCVSPRQDQREVPPCLRRRLASTPRSPTSWLTAPFACTPGASSRSSSKMSPSCRSVRRPGAVRCRSLAESQKYLRVGVSPLLRQKSLSLLGLNLFHLKGV